MKEMNRQEQTAIEAAVRRFVEAQEKGDDSPDVYITVGGKRVAVDITTLKGRGVGHAKPRLRFDKIATWFIKHMQTVLAESVPDGVTVALTITAPIRLASKTAAELEDKIRTFLRRGSTGQDKNVAINGNRIRFLCLPNEAVPAAKVIGFVHNPESDSRLLFNMTQEMLELINGEAGRRTMRVGDRWLVAVCARDSSYSEVYRYIYSQLVAESVYKKTVVVFADRRVAMLAG
ncbi:MAG: hypothetical protein IT313_12415 [Anaerolineales bacterium]|nr:hypothetical protein [Anaerolineales bacterium]